MDILKIKKKNKKIARFSQKKIPLCPTFFSKKVKNRVVGYTQRVYRLVVPGTSFDIFFVFFLFFMETPRLRKRKAPKQRESPQRRDDRDKFKLADMMKSFITWIESPEKKHENADDNSIFTLKDVIRVTGKNKRRSYDVLAGMLSVGSAEPISKSRFRWVGVDGVNRMLSEMKRFKTMTQMVENKLLFTRSGKKKEDFKPRKQMRGSSRIAKDETIFTTGYTNSEIQLAKMESIFHSGQLKTFVHILVYLFQRKVFEDFDLVQDIYEICFGRILEELGVKICCTRRLYDGLNVLRVFGLVTKVPKKNWHNSINYVWNVKGAMINIEDGNGRNRKSTTTSKRRGTGKKEEDSSITLSVAASVAEPPSFVATTSATHRILPTEIMNTGHRYNYEDIDNSSSSSVTRDAFYQDSDDLLLFGDQGIILNMDIDLF